MNPNINSELSIKEIVSRGIRFLGFIYSKRKIILIAMFIGAVLGLVYSYVKQPLYTASLSFALEDKGSSGIGGSISLDTPFGIDLGGGSSSGGVFSSSNLPELFLSRSMVERTLLRPIIFEKQKISFAELYIRNEGWRKKWADQAAFNSIEFLPHTPRSKFTRVHDSILGIIYKDLFKNDLEVLKKDKKVSIIHIHVKSSNEIFAKHFTEGLAKEVSDFYIDYKSKKARENVTILIKQTDSIRTELNNAITGAAVSVDNTFNLNPALNARKTITAKKQVDVQANTAILTELVKQTELAKVSLRKETPLIQIIDRPILPLEKYQTGKILGMLSGTVIALLISLLFLVLRMFFKQIME